MGEEPKAEAKSSLGRVGDVTSEVENTADQKKQTHEGREVWVPVDLEDDERGQEDHQLLKGVLLYPELSLEIGVPGDRGRFDSMI